MVARRGTERCRWRNGGYKSTEKREKSPTHLAVSLQLNALNVLESDTSVNVASDDGSRDVHADADGRVLLGSHAVVLGELVDLDLAELADVSVGREEGGQR